MSNLCFECNEPANCNHHVVPKSVGGTMTIPLCLVCHGLVHDRDFIKSHNLRKLGVEKAKARGVQFGRKPSVDVDKVRMLNAMGMGASAISKEMGIARSTVYRVL